MKTFYTVILKSPKQTHADGRVIFNPDKLLLKTRRRKKAMYFAQKQFEENKGHVHPFLHNCYEVKENDKTIMEFGYVTKTIKEGE